MQKHLKNRLIPYQSVRGSLGLQVFKQRKQNVMEFYRKLYIYPPSDHAS